MNEDTFEELSRLLGTRAPRPMSASPAPAVDPAAIDAPRVDPPAPRADPPMTRRELRRRESEAAERTAAPQPPGPDTPPAPPLAAAATEPPESMAPAPASLPIEPMTSTTPAALLPPPDLAAIFPPEPITTAAASDLLNGSRRARGRSARLAGRRPGRTPRGGSARARAARGPSSRVAAARTSSDRRGARPTGRASSAGVGRRLGARLVSGAAMLFVGALAVAVSLPANALIPVGETDDLSMLSSGPQRGGQALVVAPTSTVATPTRDEWGALSYAQVLAEKYGTRDYTYSVSEGPIRWPFPYTATISDGYGYRVSPCAGCSSFHQGVDFTPGAGAAIFSIADGTVVEHVEDDWSYGNYVVIRHDIDGQQVDSLYAHMQRGTSALAVGDVVTVGQFIGLVGETGEATGPHLHLEIQVEGVKVDPFAWLQAHVV